MPLTPNNREEHWLQGMVDGSTDLTPNNRRKHWYEEIINASGGGGGGTGGGVLVANFDPQTGALDKTWNEINNAPFVVLRLQEDAKVFYNFIISTTHNESVGGADDYYVEFVSITQDETVVIQFHTTSADGYPVAFMG